MKMSKTKEKFFRLTIYMKSGNSIVIDGVTKYEFKKEGNGGSSLYLEQWDCAPFKFLIMPSLDLSQIEAIVRETYQEFVNKKKAK